MNHTVHTMWLDRTLKKSLNMVEREKNKNKKTREENKGNTSAVYRVT